ncbi:nuclease [Bacillus sp. FJAT-18017]|uniref:nuclease-related domain-containing protein n=1 Tax=Bacillus sp. FJAT-18017 TaxID=1705566 RepID=UPI0006AF0285|nr:nuclease-related domain-containing protein [Bacillus sp. FJAT-18017]ALC88974.1 nuclease [Bacillus sp. FJAT-18017]
MLYKAKTKSEEHLILEYLDRRMSLKESDKQRLYRLNKGYEGEVQFEKLTSGLQTPCIILNDLTFKVNNSTIQIDSSLLFGRILKFYEVKNLEGDYYLNDDKFFMRDGTEKNNPLLQMKRSESLYRQLLKELGFDLSIEASTVFVNPAFTMYNAPLNQPIIYPTQLTRLTNQLNKIPSNLTQSHWSLADKLISLNQEKSEYTTLPDYRFDNQKKGVTCYKCHSFDIGVIGYKVVCMQCGHHEDVEAAVMRSIDELKMLFPNIKLSTSIVYDWCSIVSQSKIRRVLKKNFNIVGVHQWSFYE